MPSLAPTCSRETIDRNRERGHVQFRESMPPDNALTHARDTSELARQREGDVFLANRSRLHGCIISIAEPIEARFDDLLRRARPGGDEDGLHPFEPGRVEVAGAVDEMGGDAAFA